MNEYLILVDKKDRQWGKLEKLMVHQLGELHRAISVFIFNSKGELLLQERAEEKYHSGGLWTNTCYSRPRYGEEILWAIERRLNEEIGMSCKTDFAFNLIYKTNFANGLTEHEFDHVYFGISDELSFPEKSEVQNWSYITLENPEQEILRQPEKYTDWLKICLPRVKDHFEKTFKNNLLEYASI